MSSFHLRLFIAVLLTLALTILPLPDVLIGLRPPWVLMLILYLQFCLPNSFNIVVLLLMGLLLDVLLATVLGEHAFCLCLTAWAASSKARRFSFFSMWQQMALVGLLCLLYQSCILMIDACLGYHVAPLMFVGSAALSLILWPWVRLVADDTLRAKANVYLR